VRNRNIIPFSGQTPTVTFFLLHTHHCAYNGLPLGPSPLFRHTLLSRTDYDSYTYADDSLLVRLLVVLVACDSD
jgi:hypothetical protein